MAKRSGDPADAPPPDGHSDDPSLAEALHEIAAAPKAAEHRAAKADHAAARDHAAAARRQFERNRERGKSGKS